MVMVFVDCTDHHHCLNLWLPILVPPIVLFLLGSIIVLVIVRCLEMCRSFECMLPECEYFFSPPDAETYLRIVGVHHGLGGA